MTEVSAVIYGVGAMGQLSARLMLERGMRISGAIGHVNNVGRDLGEVIGWPEPLGVVISADAEAVLAAAKADIAILSVGVTMAQAYPYLKRCVEAKTSVLSLSEQVFYPWHCAADLAAEIDALAQANGVTVSAGGIQDVFWVNPVAVLSGASQTIDAIEGVGTANADDYGPVVTKETGIGEPAASFREMTPEEAARTNLFTITLEALAAELGLTVCGREQGVRPLIASSPVASKAAGRTIAPGEIVGIATWSRVTTEEGIPLSGEIQLKVFEDGDTETSRWVIRGMPTLHLETPHLPGRIGTCTAIVNRIADVLAAEPGLVTVERLPKPKWRANM